VVGGRAFAGRVGAEACAAKGLPKTFSANSSSLEYNNNNIM